MRNLISFLTITYIAGMFISCDEEIIPPEPLAEFSIEAFKVPERINTASQEANEFAYRVVHPEGAEAVSEVKVVFFGSDQSTPLGELTLYDDGGVLFPNDRDVVAKDGIFTNADTLALPEGEIFFQAEAVDNSQQSILSDFTSATAVINFPPVLLSINAPDTLVSGSPPVAFSATVRDSNDVQDVETVLARLLQRGSLITTDSLQLSNEISQREGEFSKLFDSTYAAERQGRYVLEFQAIDFNEDASNALSQIIFLENKAPVMVNPVVPDTVQRPASGADSLVIQIRVNDPQGPGDIQEVQFTVEREGGTPSILEMVDTGELGDVAAGDGIYSRGIVVIPESVAGTFRFTFEALDRVENAAPVVIDTLVILP